MSSKSSVWASARSLSAKAMVGVSLVLGAGLEARAQTAAEYVRIPQTFQVPANQIDVFGGLAFGAQTQPFTVGGGMESLAPGSGGYQEVTYHRGINANIVAWGVVSHTGFGWGSPGVFGSKQSAELWDLKAVAGWKGVPSFFPGGIIEYYGGVKYVSLDTASRSLAGGRHDGTFTGAGPTIGVTLDIPLVAPGPTGTGGLTFNSYYEGAILFGGVSDATNYGVSGSSTRTGYFTGESAGVSTKVLPTTTAAITFTARQYYGVVDRNLTVGGASASNNFNSFVVAVGVKQTF